MYRILNRIFGLLIVAIACQNTYAVTVSELLSALQEKQLNIQDYNFVVSKSVFLKALDDAEIKVLEQKQLESLTGSTVPVTAERMEQISRLIQVSLMSHSRNKVTGTLYQIKGIGTTTESYAVASIGDPQDEQMMKIVASSPEEQKNPDLYNIPTPKMVFVQHRLNLPNVIVNAMPPSDLFIAGNVKRPEQSNKKTYVNMDSEEMFVFPTQSTVWVKDGGTEPTFRSSHFPFWHEEALRFATEDNTTIVKESEDEIELLITADKTLSNFSFTLICSPEGRVHRFTKKSNGETVLTAEYMNFVEMEKGIMIPQMGSMWISATGLNSASPLQERTRISTILSGSINSGLTMDDLFLKIPAGSAILDQRTGREPGTRMETTQAVRLGAGVPNDIRTLNQQNDTANSE